MKFKKIIAVVMSLCMVAGVATYGAPTITQSITAQAIDSVEGSCYTFKDGVLTLWGNVDAIELGRFRNNYAKEIKKIETKEGTVLPENSFCLFGYYSNCTSIDLSNANTSNVANMNSMFRKVTENPDLTDSITA